MAVIRSYNLMNVRHLIFTDAHKIRSGIRIRENGCHRRPVPMTQHDRVEDSPIDRDQMRSKHKAVECRARKEGHHLRRMPMLQYPVRPEVFADLTKMCFE